MNKTLKFGYIIAIIVNVILLYVIHHLLEWNVFFVTERFSEVLWALDLSLQATILANLLFLVYDAAWFKHLAQIILNLLSILATFLLYWVFPFDFGLAWWNQLVKFALLLAIVAMGIAIIVEFFKLILPQHENKPVFHETR
jgi:hypothetical protein